MISSSDKTKYLQKMQFYVLFTGRVNFGLRAYQEMTITRMRT